MQLMHLKQKTFCLMWEELDLDWSSLGPHPFKVGDRIILFNYARRRQT